MTSHSASGLKYFLNGGPFQLNYSCESQNLTRKFIGTTVEIAHNSYNTLSRLIAHKRMSSNITIKTQL
jgi:hypothetical protein